MAIPAGQRLGTGRGESGRTGAGLHPGRAEYTSYVAGLSESGGSARLSRITPSITCPRPHPRSPDRMARRRPDPTPTGLRRLAPPLTKTLGVILEGEDRADASPSPNKDQHPMQCERIAAHQTCQPPARTGQCARPTNHADFSLDTRPSLVIADCRRGRAGLPILRPKPLPLERMR